MFNYFAGPDTFLKILIRSLNFFSFNLFPELLSFIFFNWVLLTNCLYK